MIQMILRQRCSYTRLVLSIVLVVLCPSLLLAETIPLTSKDGVYEVPVEINGIITLPFVLDTGATEVNIPADVVRTLARAGTITAADFLPGQTYRLADGSHVQSARVVLRSLKIGQHRIAHVRASIGKPSSPLLLGQSFLTKLGAWGIESHSHTLVLGSTTSRAEARHVPPDNAQSPTRTTWSATGILYASEAGNQVGSASLKTGSQLLHFTLSWQQAQLRGFADARAHEVGAIWRVRYYRDASGAPIIARAAFAGKMDGSIRASVAMVEKFYELLIRRKHLEAYNLLSAKKKASTSMHDIINESETFQPATDEQSLSGIKPEIITHTANRVVLKIETMLQRKEIFQDHVFRTCEVTKVGNAWYIDEISHRADQ